MTETPPPLAYVFWHARRDDVPPAVYEGALREFHQTLARESPAGFLRSFVHRIASAPWLPSTTGVYEDWYLVDGSSALDVLNAAAISAVRRREHNRAAGLAATGTAGLYRWRRGAGENGPARMAHWISKPEGEGYEAFYRRFDDALAVPGSALWGRQMVLGPTPEFCLHADAAPAIPGASPISIELAPLLL